MQSLSLNEKGGPSVREQYATHHLEAELLRLASADEGLTGYITTDKDGKLLLQPPEPRSMLGDGSPEFKHPHKVAIVGAGVTGLLGMMLDFFNEHVDGFKVGYDIFEAGPPERVGGRLFSYKFPVTPNSPAGPHDYYDVGGMRFPENPIMDRVFDLFTWLKMPKVCADQFTSDTPNGSLIPYSMTNKKDDVQNEPFCYNGTSKWGSYLDIAAKAENFDAFGFNKNNLGDGEIPTAVLKMNPDDVINDAMQKLRDAIKDNEQKGWDLLMSYDKHTTRDWLGSNWDHHGFLNPALPPFNATTINFLETMNGGTDWYDQAFSETVLESLDFTYNDPKKDKKDPNQYPWWCIMGGAQQLPILMEQQLSKKPAYNTAVKAIRAIPDGLSPWQMEVTTTSDIIPKQYNGVFNTTTLGCLRRIDTSGCAISNPAKMAHRALAYGQSCKVGIKFSHAWWLHSLPKEHRITSGGLGHSDLHIRTVVYPSYNIHDDPSQPAVLLVSYTWQQDAERVGALISQDSPAGEDELKKLLLRELAKLHTETPEAELLLHEQLRDLWYLDHYAHDWSHDAHTAGAFAFFRAQQFSTLWPRIVMPSGNLVVAGEAASPHHAWVVGALESAVVGLYSWLSARQDIPGAAEVMRVIDGEVQLDKTLGDCNPFLGLPFYMPKEHARVMGVIAGVKGEQRLEAMKLGRV
ncbi:hypothetical protein QBC47DRAFT_444804 [Echria macrotheca]|uniref:Amine oxidase domain-containing protein n=1 Tax=Echria macrotheca TaxID=438768 RepID=A0AAJ0BDR2_9PEZI|nr:hypothetical protein QBC47DRAFT_444804 [Echria macrotheca]